MNFLQPEYTYVTSTQIKKRNVIAQGSPWCPTVVISTAQISASALGTWNEIVPFAQHGVCAFLLWSMLFLLIAEHVVFHDYAAVYPFDIMSIWVVSREWL